MSEQKLYCGTGKIVDTGQFSFLKLSISPEDLDRLVANKSESGWATIKIMKRKEPSAKGSTHYGVIDTWQPNGQKKKADDDFIA